MIKTQTKQVVDVSDWDALVSETYKRIYSFQQLDGGKDRGKFYLTVPNRASDYENDTVPEYVGTEAWVSVSRNGWLVIQSRY